MQGREADHEKNPDGLADAVRTYWNEHIHDLAVARHPVGTREFFDELDEYRFDKLRYLPGRVDFSGCRGKRLLEIGCGAGVDLVRFAMGGADVAGVDISETAVSLARANFALRGLAGDLRVMDGGALDFPDRSFDAVYAHGVLQYAVHPGSIVREAHRVLVPGGRFIAMVYNRKGWLNTMSKLAKVDLEHQDAPVLKTYTRREFRNLLDPFPDVRIVPDRFPVRSRLHGGVKGFLYNTFFVGMFTVIPKPLIRWTGWHLMAFATK